MHARARAFHGKGILGRAGGIDRVGVGPTASRSAGGLPLGMSVSYDCFVAGWPLRFPGGANFMKTISLRLEEELDAALEALCAAQGREKADLVRQIVCRYVETERLKRTLQDPALVDLYQQLAAEDVARAEEGMAEYQRLLEASDHA